MDRRWSRGMVAALVVVVAGSCGDDHGASSVSSTTSSRQPTARADAWAAPDVPQPDGATLDSSGASTPPDVAATPPVDSDAGVDSSEPTTVEPAPADINLGFIGGRCTSDSECAYEGGFCQPDEAGFPGGHCSKSCDRFCPDADGHVTTFCIDPADAEASEVAGMCVTRCDFGESPTGCRSGYRCAPLSRYGESHTVVHACVPGHGDAPEMSACVQTLLERGIGFELASNPMDHPDGHPDAICDVSDPVWVDGVIGDVAFRYGSIENAPKRLFASCPLVVALSDFAKLAAAVGVTDIIHLGIYNCRFIGGTTTLSEHARANAVDIAGARLDSGEVYTIEEHWQHHVAEPTMPGDIVLKTLARTAFADGLFNIILTPEYNAGHDDHLHCDLKEGASFYSE